MKQVPLGRLRLALLRLATWAAVLAVVAIACGGQVPNPAAGVSSPAPPINQMQAATESPVSSSPITPPLTPTGTPAPSKPLPTSTNPPLVAEDTGSADVALGFLEEIVDTLGSRASATVEEEEAAEFLAAKFRSFGYTVEVQDFSVGDSSVDTFAVRPAGSEYRDFQGIVLSKSGIGSVTGPVMSMGLGTEQDLSAGTLDGKIALVERGIVTFQETVTLASDAGAAGVVIYNNQFGNFRGALSTPSSIPVISIAGEAGEVIEEMLRQGPVEAVLAVEQQQRPSRNVVAEIPGEEPGVVVLGAHYDTVPEVDGANDNGSGTSVLLAVAQALAEKPLPFTLRMVAFGSEEIGLVGSQFYVDSLSEDERSRVAAMVNFDALGSGTGLRVLGDQRFIDALLAEGKRQGKPVRSITRLAGSSSDHASFAGAGIPVVAFLGDDFSRIHSSRDTIDFVEADLLGNAVDLGLFLIEHLSSDILGE